MDSILAPSILSADFSRLGEQVDLCRDAGARYLHIDVMDGEFVPNISIGPPVIRSIRKCTDMFFDVHLMVEEPMRYISDFRDAGADSITVHYEACRHPDRTIWTILKSGAKAAVALNPATPVQVLKHILPDVDMVLLMGVNPGFGGQRFFPYVTAKIRELKEMADALCCPIDIEVDGGVTFDNAAMLKEAGVNVFVAGSAIFKGDITANIKRFLSIFRTCG